MSHRMMETVNMSLFYDNVTHIMDPESSSVNPTFDKDLDSTTFVRL